MVRLRQIAFAATDLPAAEEALRDALGVRLCHRDPGVAVFGLRNALFPVGDQFLEIVSPVGDATAAGRLLARRGGDCGYMVLLQVDDLGPVERRLAAAGVRIVFDAAADGIRGLHLHPKDVPGAIVSVDAADDPAEWPWAGPDWRAHVDPTTVTAITGMDVAVDDPAAAAAIWGDVLGIDPDGSTLHLDDATIRFVGRDGGDAGPGITAVDLATARPDLEGTSLGLLGVSIRFGPR
jgi:catechol 2,3-dioxygenase-like lactoylglutathione lyase family enzyme